MPQWRRLVTEPGRPAVIRDHRFAHWFVVATVCIGAFMGQLDASIVTLAFPALESQFDVSVGAVTWIGLVYLLVLVGLVSAVGRLADMVGRKLLYTYGFAVFIIGSALCGIAPSLLLLCVFRAVQAVGAAMLQANSVAIIFHAMPRNMLGRGIGVQGAAQALGLALGPSVGGLLVDLGGWRWIFWVNIPLGCVGMVLGWLCIPRSRGLLRRSRFDWVGLVLFVPAIAAALAAISLGNGVGWTSKVIIALLAVGAVLLVAFVLHERSTVAPMINLALFRRIPFSAGISSGMLSYLVLFGVMFVVPFYLQRAVGDSAGMAGLVLTIMPVVLGVIAPLAGRWADRWGARPLTVVGMGVSVVALVGFALLHTSMTAFVVALALLGLGMGLFTPANNAAIMAAAPPEQSGVAGGVLNMTRGLGTALGLAATALVFGAIAGQDPHQPNAVMGGFVASIWFLAAVALVAGLLAALRGRGALR